MTSTNFYELPSSQPLSDAYAKQTDSRLGALFHSGHPADDKSWQARSSRLDSMKERRAASADVAEALKQYNARLGMSQETAEHIEAIGQGAQVIVGGQQAGLWTGPILVIHKAVTIIAAAKHASQVLGRTVIPVFWIAGEDHDWDEANHITAVTEQGLRKLAVARPEGPRTSVSRTAVTPETWEAAIADLESVLTGSEFKEPLLGKLREIAGSANSLSDSFAHLMAWLFGEYGLVLIDADDAAIRAVEAPMFRRMIAENDALEAAYAASENTISSLGYRMQAAAAPDCANLFLFRPEDSAAGLAGDRVLLYKREGGFTDRKGESFWSTDELLSIAESRPELLSNNVLTRPVMQDYLFPVLAAVLGAGEIAYWAQIGGAFRHFGMEMPILAPRMSFTLVEGTTAKHMMKYELSFDDVVHRFEERRQQWLTAQDRFDIPGRFGAAKREFESLYAPLVELAGEVQAGLAALGATNMSKILEQIDFLQNRTQDALRKSHDASLRHWDRIGSAIWPGGKPQERVVNMTAYYNRYGTDWLAKLLAIPYAPGGEHQIVYL